MGQLAWWSVPECKNEAEGLVCICLKTLCNGIIPTTKEILPEGGNVQDMVMLVIILLPVLMIAVAIDCIYTLKLTKNLNYECYVWTRRMDRECGCSRNCLMKWWKNLPSMVSCLVVDKLRVDVEEQVR